MAMNGGVVVMEESIDLGNVADRLSKEFPQIRGMYLFGSRVFGTGSPRSDIDILLETDERIRPADLRQIACGELAALDLFLIQGGRATSIQNESYIEADSLSALVELLKAKKFWDRDSGRLSWDISWMQRVTANMQFVPTALPMSSESNREHPEDLFAITWDQLRQIVRATPIEKLLIAIAGIVSFFVAVFYVGVWTAQFMD